MSDTPPTPQAHRNQVTIYNASLRVQRPVPPLRRSLQSLVDTLGPELAASELPAFAVVAMRGGTRRQRTVLTIDHGHLVAGRHLEAGLHLDGDPSVSLRHLLIRAVHLEDGTAALRVLDLDTPGGFGIEGGDEVRSLLATGPFAIAVGEWVIAGIPHGPARLRGADGAGPYRVAAPVVHRAERVPQRADEDHRRSHITLLPRAHWAGAASTASGVAQLELSSRRGQDTLTVTGAMLDHGVLLGRYERCVGHGAAGVTTATVSRTHALILRDAGEDRVYDLSSTGGTFVAGRRVQSAALSPGPCRIRLASDDPVHVAWSRFDS